MGSELVVPVMAVDFAVPAQSFRIEYSLISRKAPPFVREFMLKLLNVSSFRAEEIGQFFGFNRREIDVALSDLLNKGDAEYREDGRVALTDQARRYFDAQGNEPTISIQVEAREPFSFDLLSFSYIGKNFRNEGWRSAIEVGVAPEARANSQDFARQAFQRNFMRIYELGHIGGGRDEQAPDLYKISDVAKERDGFVRVQKTFRIDPVSGQIDRNEDAQEIESSVFVEAVTRLIDERRQPDNTIAVAECAQALGDDYMLSLLGATGLDLKEAVIRVLTEGADTRKPEGRLFGSIHLPNNWARIQSLLKRHRERLSVGATSGPVELTWLVPGDPYWGRSLQALEALHHFQDAAKGVGKRADQTIIRPRLYFPLSDANDERGVRLLRGQYEDMSGVVYGYASGANSICFEALVLPGCFAVVIYHLSQPKVGDIPIPVGFVTEDLAVVGKVDAYVSSFLGGYSSGTSVRDIGKLADHRAWSKKGQRK